LACLWSLLNEAFMIWIYRFSYAAIVLVVTLVVFMSVLLAFANKIFIIIIIIIRLLVASKLHVSLIEQTILLFNNRQMFLSRYF
jgi:hypothetical protein